MISMVNKAAAAEAEMGELKAAAEKLMAAEKLKAEEKPTPTSIVFPTDTTCDHPSACCLPALIVVGHACREVELTQPSAKRSMPHNM